MVSATENPPKKTQIKAILACPYLGYSIQFLTWGRGEMDDPHAQKKKKYINDCPLPSCFKENSAHLSTELRATNQKKQTTKPREKALKPTLKDLTQQFYFWDLCFPNFQQLLFFPNGMGSHSLAHRESAQAAGILCPALIPGFCHTLRAFPLFSSGHQTSLQHPKPPDSKTNGQIQGSFLKNVFVSASCPFPDSPRHRSTSDLGCQDPVLLHLYKYRRKAPRHCQDVCIIQVRGRRENKREAGA